MAAPSPLGTITIAVDGLWDMDDLREVSESLSESYGLFYPLVASDEAVRDRLQDAVRKRFWSGEFENRNFGLILYRQIPENESMKLRSFSYASPGSMVIAGVLPVLYMLSHVTRAWIKTGDQFLTLWERVDAYFEKRAGMRRPRKNIEVDDDLAITVEEARVLVFDVGAWLGFDPLSCERLIEVAGNPIATLKFLVAAGREGRKLAGLQNAGKLKLPEPADSSAALIPPGRTSRRKVSTGAVRKGIKPRGGS